MAKLQKKAAEEAAETKTLNVFMAFERDEEGELRPAFEAQEMPSEFAAINRAKLMSKSYAGVIAWSRPARPDVGEFGEPTVLFRAGEVPDLE
jgi:hypothetical protein